MPDQTPPQAPASNKGRWLGIIGIAVLVVGIGVAITVYWLGTRAAAYQDDLSMVGYGRSQRIQMGQMYGKMGTMIEDISDDLHDPGTQAEIIAGSAILIAVGCFYFARLMGNDNEPAGTSQPGYAPQD